MLGRFRIQLFLGALAGLLLRGPAIRAQAISPVIVEYKEKARGQFQVSNDTLYPLDVLLEPFSFTVDANGQPTYGPLEPGIHVRLSSTGFRLGPKQIYTVYYEATADVVPAWFTIYATLARANTHANFRVAFQLPHTVYLLPGKLLQPEALQFHQAETYNQGTTHVEVENRSEDFARVQEVDLVCSSGKKIYPGFPFFPHQRRVLQLEADQCSSPQRVVLKFVRFKVEQAIRDGGASP
jgi:hypothetical protein